MKIAVIWKRFHKLSRIHRKSFTFLKKQMLPGNGGSRTI